MTVRCRLHTISILVVGFIIKCRVRGFSRMKLEVMKVSSKLVIKKALGNYFTPMGKSSEDSFQ
jgi:hypothetical protein